VRKVRCPDQNILHQAFRNSAHGRQKASRDVLGSVGNDSVNDAGPSHTIESRSAGRRTCDTRSDYLSGGPPDASEGLNPLPLFGGLKRTVIGEAAIGLHTYVIRARPVARCCTRAEAMAASQTRHGAARPRRGARKRARAWTKALGTRFMGAALTRVSSL
jgi:hypothetical protein